MKYLYKLLYISAIKHIAIYRKRLLVLTLINLELGSLEIPVAVTEIGQQSF
jgi:hypothetical protein